MSASGLEFEELMAMLIMPHHRVSPGPLAPESIECIVEMPEDCPVKIELCKKSGLPRVDRPQKYSSRNQTPYGLFPQTHCGPRVARLAMQRTGRKKLIGDGDPLDLCVITSIHMPYAVALEMRVRPIGGLPMIDKSEADDKIIAVLENDLVYSKLEDISQMPADLLAQVTHYFVNYKRAPGEDPTDRVVEIEGTYGREEALAVIRASMEDYKAEYGTPRARLRRMKVLLAEQLRELESQPKRRKARSK